MDLTRIRLQLAIYFCLHRGNVSPKRRQAGKLTFDHERRTIWIADAHRSDGKRFIVRADEKFTALLELERVICVAY